MRFTLLLSFVTTALIVAAQTDTSYQLLWYKGKKITPNILLTPKGDTVRFDANTASIQVISKSVTGKRFNQMLLELNKTNQRIQEQVDRLCKFLKE